jgi:hypothetical protein
VFDFTLLSVTSTGNITIAGIGSLGIYATSFAGAVTVTSTGNITSGGLGAYGIKATGTGAVNRLLDLWPPQQAPGP